MKKAKSIIKKIAIGISILVLNSLGFLNSVQASQISSANLYSIGDCGQLLKYKGSIVKVSYVEYIENGVNYPAYCLDKTKPGAESGAYSVSVNQAIQDVGLWRRVINGYPYKSLEELGVATKEEAFTATKQAIYCYIHGNNPDDYEGIGEAGQRTLNAMRQIISNAENSNETKISSTISINKQDSEWKQDSLDKNYVSKTYTVSGGGVIQNYKITLSKENGQDLGGIKLTDEQNNERQEFSPNEKFKILIPIKNMTQKGEFKLEVEAKIYTKPVLYGTAPDSGKQDYALTAATYEDGTGNCKDEYFKNETKIIVIKQDEETEEKLEGVEFQLLDENKNVVYTGLKTDSEGKVVIENLVPGNYYLKESNTIDGYAIYEELIRLEVELNEQTTVTVNNREKEKPTIETTQEQLSLSSKEVKRLPVTGM